MENWEKYCEARKRTRLLRQLLLLTVPMLDAVRNKENRSNIEQDRLDWLLTIRNPIEQALDLTSAEGYKYLSFWYEHRAALCIGGQATVYA